jgi:hypothetical protein
LRSLATAMMIFGARWLPSWRRAIVLVGPETILRWHRAGFRLFWRRRSRSRKTSPLPREAVNLIRDMAPRGRLWGAERIRGELLKLGIKRQGHSSGVSGAPPGMPRCAPRWDRRAGGHHQMPAVSAGAHCVDVQALAAPRPTQGEHRRSPQPTPPRPSSRYSASLSMSSNAVPTGSLARAGPYFGPYFSVAP